MNGENLARQVASYRVLDAEDAETLVAAAVVLLRTADDGETWRLFAEALNRARPLAVMATHPVWAELRPPPRALLVMRVNRPQGPQGLAAPG